MKINAIIFGATGMVGEGILLGALNHEDIESVLVIGRRPCMITHDKLKELIHHDFFDYSAVEERLKGYNACFFCLGVSSMGMNEKDYTRTTYDLTMQAASALSRINPGMTFCYVSGTGTDSTGTGQHDVGSCERENRKSSQKTAVQIGVFVQARFDETGSRSEKCQDNLQNIWVTLSAVKSHFP